MDLSSGLGPNRDQFQPVTYKSTTIGMIVVAEKATIVAEAEPFLGVQLHCSSTALVAKTNTSCFERTASKTNFACLNIYRVIRVIKRAVDGYFDVVC